MRYEIIVRKYKERPNDNLRPREMVGETMSIWNEELSNKDIDVLGETLKELIEQVDDESIPF